MNSAHLWLLASIAVTDEKTAQNINININGYITGVTPNQLDWGMSKVSMKLCPSTIGQLESCHRGKCSVCVAAQGCGFVKALESMELQTFYLALEETEPWRELGLGEPATVRATIELLMNRISASEYMLTMWDRNKRWDSLANRRKQWFLWKHHQLHVDGEWLDKHAWRVLGGFSGPVCPGEG